MPAIISPKRLYDATEASHARLKSPREHRKTAYREFLGNHYSSQSDKPRLLNLINRGVRVMLAYLAGRHGEFDVSARSAAHRGQAELAGVSLNLLCDRIRFIDTIRLGLMDALLGPMAIYRVGLRAADEMYLLQGKEYVRGVPYLRRVSFDSYVTDVGAEFREQRLFDGEEYDVPREALLESGLFRRDVVERLPTSSGTPAGRASGIATLSGRPRDERSDLVEYVRLCDYLLYCDGVTYKATLPVERGHVRDFLRIDQYDGPDESPFEFAEFFPVPDQPFGLPWVSIARDQAHAVNEMLARMKTQVDHAQRRLVASAEADDDEIDAIVNGDEGAIAKVADVNSVKDVQQGGFSPEILGFSQLMIRLYDAQYGGFDIVSGTRDKDTTAAEYSDQAAKAGLVMADPESVHYRVVQRLGRKLAFWHFSDPFFHQVLSMRMPGTEAIDVSFTAEQLRQDFERFQFTVRPRSMRLVDPNVKARRTIEFLGFVLQAAQVAAATGGLIDLQAIVRVGRDEFDIERADEFVRDPVLMMQSAQMAQMVASAGKGQPQGHVGTGGGWIQPEGARTDPRSVVHSPGRDVRPGNRFMSPAANLRSALSTRVPM